MTPQERHIIDAVMYALRSGCFFPVPEPTPPYSVPQLVQWGAMRNLHTAIAEYSRVVHPQPGGADTWVQALEREVARLKGADP